MHGKDKFRQGLIDLGYEVKDHGGNFLSVSYCIEGGRFNERTIRLGFDVPGDFDLNPPHGPHVSPLLFPVNTNSSDHSTRMHRSKFGADWGHLSRPFPNWNNTNRTVKEYMRWVKHILGTL